MSRKSLPIGVITHRGFTLVEIMVVVVIIGLLAALAIPAFQRLHFASTQARFINDLRIIREAAETYAMENGSWPPDGSAALHPDLLPYLKENVDGNSPIGGVWDWDFEQFGFTAGISVFGHTLTNAQLQAIDAKIDDGVLNAGNFRVRAGGVIYIMEF